MQAKSWAAAKARHSMPSMPSRALVLRCQAIARPSSLYRDRQVMPRTPKPVMAAAQESFEGTSQVMLSDYGFRSGTSRLYQDHDGEVPKSVLELASENFQHELLALRQFLRFEEYDELPPSRNFVQKALYSVGSLVRRGLGGLDAALEQAGVIKELQPAGKTMADAQAQEQFRQIKKQLDQLRLDNEVVIQYENERKAREGETVSPWFIKLPYLMLCWALDLVFDGRPIQRFWVLEEVARIPYFSYISMLHLYESLGWWRAGAELRKIHFAEEWNELHHLQIMESLGGDRLWIDRFVAQHAALVYYWVLVVFFMLSPRLAYNFSELVEHHATDTYNVFAETNKELLQQIPPPKVAVEYYKGADLYLFDEFQTSSGNLEPRRPPCENLYDVFINIRDDEVEHVKTMVACQEAKITKDVAQKRLRSQA